MEIWCTHKSIDDKKSQELKARGVDKLIDLAALYYDYQVLDIDGLDYDQLKDKIVTCLNDSRSSQWIVLHIIDDWKMIPVENAIAVLKAFNSTNGDCKKF